MQLAEILKLCGLSPEEGSIYLFLLQKGARPASRIANGVGLKRGHTYNLLLSLTAKGLVTEFLQGKIKYFLASDPQKLITTLDDEIASKSNLRRTVERHLELFPEAGRLLGGRPEIRYFNGLDGVRLVYEESLKQPGASILAFADFDYIFLGKKRSEIDTWMWKYCEERARKNITYQGIVNRSAASDAAYKLRRKQKRELKLIHKAPLPAEILVFGSCLAIISLKDDPMAILIQNAPIAAAFRALHQTFWEILPDYSLEK